MVAKYGESFPGPRLDGTRLDAILAERIRASPERESYWAQFRRWLQGHLREHGLDLAVDWLDMLRAQPGSAFEWVWRLSMAAIIILALVVLVNEVRQGRRRRWRRMRPTGFDAAPVRATSAVPSLETVSALPLDEQPSAVLRIVLAALAVRGMTVAGEGATHREIAGAAADLGGRLGTLLAHLAKLAERARYGGWRPDRCESETVVALGRTLLGQGVS